MRFSKKAVLEHIDAEKQRLWKAKDGASIAGHNDMYFRILSQIGLLDQLKEDIESGNLKETLPF